MSPSPYFTIPFLLLVAIFQANAAPRLAVGSARPDLMLLSVVSWSLLAAFRARELEYGDEAPSLMRGINDGVVWAFVGGMFLDLLSSGPLGANALALMVTALAAGVIGVRVSGAAPILAPLMAALGTLIYHLVYLAVLALTGQPVFLDVYMNRFILPGVVFNLALVPVVYLLLMMVDRRTSRERLEW